jgi:hypothetical protein
MVGEPKPYELRKRRAAILSYARYPSLPIASPGQATGIQTSKFKDLSPTLYPRLLSPRRAKEVANSPMWPTPFTEVLPAEWQWANYHGGLCATAPDHKDSALWRLAGVVGGFLMVGKTKDP